jgi:hypothetical protein
MPAEMTAQERLEAAVSLQPCDRVPVGFPLSWFAARHAGITMAQFANDCEAHAAAIYKTYQDLGGFDLLWYNLAPTGTSLPLPMKQKVPGKDLPPDSIIQYHEQEIMTADEYDIVINKGWRYYNEKYILSRVLPEFNSPSGKIAFKNKEKEVKRVADKIRPLFSKSLSYMDGYMAMPPFETLSMARSFAPFLLDLYRRPEKVITAMNVMMAESIEAVSSQLKSGKKKLFGNTAISRSASNFISTKVFEKFVFPYIKELVELYSSVDLIMIFHLDQNWLKFLPYFKQLPEGRYILQLDGLTDIFEAKKIVGDRMCLMGDVPARLFKLGSVSDVEQYCQKLIDVVGKGSGFILSCG